MRHMLLTASLFLTGLVNAQDQWSQIFSTDPYLSNGYFIVNDSDWQRLNLSRIDIDIVASTATQRTTLQSFSITNGFYGKVDLGFLDTLQGEQRVFYTLKAFDQGNTVVLNYEALPLGGGGDPWPLWCSHTCNSASYAWTINLYSNGSQSYMVLNDAFMNDSYYYFYVTMNDWPQFQQQYSPSDFGLSEGVGGWYDYLPGGTLVGDQVVKFTGGDDPLPPGAHDMQGFEIDGGLLDEGGYAIAKHRGPWASGGMLYTDNYEGGGEMCYFDLVEMFNNDPLVQFTLNQNGQDPLTCNNNILITGGDTAISWGDGHTGSCTSISITYSDGSDGEINIIDWTETVVACTDFETPHNILEAVSSINIDNIGAGYKTPVLSLEIPSDRDPRLVPVPKTVLDSGLYEFNIIMNDGTILHHYEDFTAPVVINADFADFADINIYPVPVKDRFAVAFDLVAPMDINMTVVDNMGTTYYQKALHFTMAGRNKEVVHMDTQWPTGLYHAIFQFADGSTQTLNFTVAAE